MSKKIASLEEQLKNLPEHQLKGLRNDFFFNLASVVYALSQHQEGDEDPILTKSLLIQQSEQAVMQAFDRFLSKYGKH